MGPRIRAIPRATAKDPPMTRFSRISAPTRTSLLAGLLAACSGTSPETAQTTAAQASTAAAPETKPGLSLSYGRLVLPAVSGNPAAAYFTLTNRSPKPVTVAAVDVAGSMMVMLHETRQEGSHATMADLAPPVLQPGETVVTEGTLRLIPGARVQVREPGGPGGGGRKGGKRS